MTSKIKLYALTLLLGCAAKASAVPVPTCTTLNSQPFWFNTGTTVIQCPTPCSDGSYLRCNALLQEEVQCVNGDILLLQPPQAGPVINQIGQCPTPAPANCGANENGTTWWQDSSTTTTIVCNTCWDGSPQYCNVEVQNQYICSNGDTSATGRVQQGAVLGYQNECLPKPPQACGQQASGSVWWVNAGTQTNVCSTCRDGSQITCTYNTQVQDTCNNGVTSATGQTQQGSLISKNGQCPVQPRSCGNVANGQTTWQNDGQTPPYPCETCADGSAHICISTQQQQMICNDGTLSPTGKLQNGGFLGYSNTCPNVVSGSETYNVPSAAPKADVLFILDTRQPCSRLYSHFPIASAR